MKATGIVRQIDHMGRFVIPMEMRRVLHLENKDSMEVYTEGDAIILKKYEPSCIFCRSADDIISFKGHNICRACLTELNRSTTESV